MKLTATGFNEFNKLFGFECIITPIVCLPFIIMEVFAVIYSKDIVTLLFSIFALVLMIIIFIYPILVYTFFKSGRYKIVSETVEGIYLTNKDRYLVHTNKRKTKGYFFDNCTEVNEISKVAVLKLLYKSYTFPISYTSYK